jgi:hypothetical protein
VIHLGSVTYYLHISTYGIMAVVRATDQALIWMTGVDHPSGGIDARPISRFIGQGTFVVLVSQ